MPDIRVTQRLPGEPAAMRPPGLLSGGVPLKETATAADPETRTAEALLQPREKCRQIRGEARGRRFRLGPGGIDEIAQRVLREGCAAGFGQVDLDGSAVPWIIRADDQSLPFQCDHGLRDGALGRAQKCCEGTGMARVAIGAREIPERFPLRRNQATAPLQRVGQAAETLDQVGDTWGMLRHKVIVSTRKFICKSSGA